MFSRSMRAAALFLLCPLIQPQAGWRESVEERFDQLIAQAEALGPEKLGQEIARLGRGAVPLVLAGLEQDVEDGALRSAVCAMGRGSFLPLEESASLPPRVVLALLEDVGDAGDLQIILDEPSLEGMQLETTLAAILRRDERAWGVLLGASLEATPELACSVIRAVGQVGGERTVDWLSELLAYEPPYELLILSELHEAARHASAEERTRQGVRRRLWIAGDDQLLRKAIQVAAVLEDDEALERIIELLSHENLQVGKAAHRALVAISSVSLPFDQRSWVNWLKRERSWFDKHAERTFFELRAQNKSRVMTAIRELATRRYERRAIIRELGPMTRHSDAHVRRVACDALRQIGLSEARLDLQEALKDEDAGVAAAARRALLALGASPSPDRAAVNEVAAATR